MLSLSVAVVDDRRPPRIGNASCGMNGAPAAWAFTSGEFPILAPPLRLGEFVATLALAQDNAFGQPLESQLRSCLLATWMCEAAGFEQGRARHRLLGRAAAVCRLHRPRPRGGHRLRRRDRDPRPDAGPRRGESRRGDARRRGLRDRRSLPGGARADRPDDPADRPRVGGAQLLVGVRSGRHARATARLRPRPSATRCASRSSAGTAMAIPPMRAATRSRWRCASCTSVTTWRRLAASSRRTRPSTPPAIVATAPTTRHSPTCSSRTDAAGSTGSPRWSRGTRVLDLEPEPRRMLDGADLDNALTVAADFVDLKSPYMAGHSRRCARARRRRRAAARVHRGCHHRAPQGRAACTTSARPRCRTRSGTSPARSRVRSSIASSFTRC